MTTAPSTVAAPALVEPLSRPAVGERWHHFDAATAEPIMGRQLRLIRDQAPDWRTDFAASGTPDSVTTHDLLTLPYPTKFGLFRAALSPSPYLAITNRCVVVRWTDADGRIRTLLFEPTDAELAANTAYFKAIREMGGPVGPAIERTTLTIHGSVSDALDRLAIDPRDVDYLVFDHLHTQDVRRLLGTTVPQPDLGGAVEPLFPHATLLVQREELEAMADLHPLQQVWYQVETFRDVRPDAITALDGDTRLGPGVGLLYTPGHTHGNQSLVLNTADGIWASSENAIAVECLVPQHSRIPGVRRWAASMAQEVVLNANTLELTALQYNSIIKEKSVVDMSSRDERFPQFLPSSELTPAWWSPGTKPTFRHGGITHHTR